MTEGLLADTQLTLDPTHAGRFLATVGPAWSYLLPSGGVLMSFALRALREHLAEPGMRLVSATTIFCDPIPEGPVTIDVVVLRRGRSGSQLRARLAPIVSPVATPVADSLVVYGLEVSATFLRDRPGPDVQPARMPDVPLPAASIPYESNGRWRFFDNFDVALALGEPMWKQGWQKGEAHQAFWHRYRKAPVGADGVLDSIAIPPIADTMPGALARFLGPESGPMYAPSLDLTVYFTAAPRSEWLLVETRASIARNGWGVGHASIWDTEGTLVAQASQGMFLRNVRKNG